MGYGNNADDIYQSFKLSSEENTYTNVKQRFKEHFKGKAALVFERTQFVRRKKKKELCHLLKISRNGLTFVLSVIYRIKWSTRK